MPEVHCDPSWSIEISWDSKHSLAIAVGDTYGNMKHCAHVENGWLKKAQVIIAISIPKVELVSSHDECFL